MKNLLFSLFSLFLLISCSGDDDQEVRELNLTMQSVSAIMAANPEIVAYPNPFSEVVILDMGEGTNAEVLISNDKGDFRKFTVDSRLIQISFAGEKSGTYQCEIARDGVVQRIYLIKQ